MQPLFAECARAVARILRLRDRGWLHVLDADITSYFDQISHSRLLKLIQAARLESEVLRLLSGCVKAEIWDGREIHPLRCGIAQGSPISPRLHAWPRHTNCAKPNRRYGFALHVT